MREWTSSIGIVTISVAISLIAASCGAQTSGHPGIDTAESTSAATETPSPPSQQSLSPCGGAIDLLYEHLATVEAIAWASHEIVVGTVIERRDPAWGALIAPDIDPKARHVVTDFVVQVEARLRGGSNEQILVRQLGGTIGDCVVEGEAGNTPLAVGERVLLFLREPTLSTTDPFELTGGNQGVWFVTPEGSVMSSTDHFDASSGQSFDALAKRIADALTGNPPPPRDVNPTLIVPTSEAPVADEIPDLPTAIPESP